MRQAQQLGRYHLLDRIAIGGMAEIYRARTFDPGGHSYLVAIKRVLTHLAEDEDFIQMLIDEAKIASMLRHPNIARVYEFARAHGEYFMAMEHIDGKDARAILDRCREAQHAMPPYHAAYIAAEVASALHSAHSALDHSGRPLRIVHRDVSPANIMVSYTGDVKLCDFGIAKATSSEVRTRSGVIKGKLKYMSPEQALGLVLDHRSDLFSLGACLYEWLTGVPPFIAVNEIELLEKIRDCKFRPILELAPSTPPELATIATQCLARACGDRYQSASELESDLRSSLRRHAPAYSRSHLRRYLCQQFAVEIENELRMLGEYCVANEVSDDVGENLIALGTQDILIEPVPFQPHPGGPVTATVVLEDIDLLGDNLDLNRAAPIAEAAFDLHAATTLILDPRRSPRRDI